jgi:hypothetical protein
MPLAARRKRLKTPAISACWGIAAEKFEVLLNLAR